MTGHRERWQSLYTHMRLLGCDEIASLASEKLALALHCVQTRKHLFTWQVSQLGVVFRGLQIGKETSETSQSRSRTRRTTTTRRTWTRTWSE